MRMMFVLGIFDADDRVFVASGHVMTSVSEDGCKLVELENSCSGVKLGSEIETPWS
jgi:hypothetical protein